VAGAFGFELFLEVRLGVVLELHQDASADLCSVSESRSRLPVAMHRCQANPESNPPTLVEGRNGGRRDLVRGPIEARPRPSSVCRTRRMASRDGTPGLVHVVEGFDVLVQLLVHRWGSYGFSHDFTSIRADRFQRDRNRGVAFRRSGHLDGAIS
jgi:hypothetical protein